MAGKTVDAPTFRVLTHQACREVLTSAVKSYTSMIEVTMSDEAVKPKSFAGMRCSIAGALELIGDRWALLVIRDLSLGLSRYDDLRASTGIPAATLAARLKHLDGERHRRARPLSGAPAARRISPDAEGARPVEGQRRAARMGRPLGRERLRRSPRWRWSIARPAGR